MKHVINRKKHLIRSLELKLCKSLMKRLGLREYEPLEQQLSKLSEDDLEELSYFYFRK